VYRVYEKRNVLRNLSHEQLERANEKEHGPTAIGVEVRVPQGKGQKRKIGITDTRQKMNSGRDDAEKRELTIT